MPATASTLSPLADIIDSRPKADREGRLRECIRFLCRSSLLTIDEIGYLTVEALVAGACEGKDTTRLRAVKETAARLRRP